MKIKPLYRYRREDGKIADSPIKPDCDYLERVRIIAEDGKLVTNDGKRFYSVKDTNSTEGWYEVDKEVINEIRSAQ